MVDRCRHLKKFKNTKGTQAYQTILTFLVACHDADARRVKALQGSCFYCNSVEPRLHSCLECMFFGCHTKGHMKQHYFNMNHCLSVDLSYGNVLCFVCRDYVYDSELLKLKEEIVRTRGPSPSDGDRRLIQANSHSLTYDTTVGLRGLVNLGNTCFMNCVLQTLTHTPPLRHHFLFEHVIHVCQPDCCLVCEIIQLFHEFHSGCKPPLVVSRLLMVVWKQAEHLAGYLQQDAQEFFITILNLLHCQCKRSRPTSPGSCDCIVDQAFLGSMQSDLVCTACSHVSVTIDPFWDISLELHWEARTIMECLYRFTQVEHLGAVRCEKCNSAQQSTKQLSINTLPMIVCLHLKRFAAISVDQHRKISTKILFQPEIDFNPFMSSVRNSQDDHGAYSLPAVQDNRYSLFAVINHQGSLNTGHYTAFVRHQWTEWVKCDDHIVTRASINQVLDSECYMLFYHKRIM